MSVAQICEAIESAEFSLMRPLLWERLVEGWANLCNPEGSSIRSIDGEFQSAEEFRSVNEMWRTQRLDMDYLSDDEDVHPPEP